MRVHTFAGVDGEDVCQRNPPSTFMKRSVCGLPLDHETHRGARQSFRTQEDDADRRWRGQRRT